MYIVLIIIILFQIVIFFVLSNLITVLKGKVIKRDLAIQVKENQIVIANNNVLRYEQKNESTVKNLLNIKNFENLDQKVEFPVIKNEDGTGMLISRRCQNECVIESHDYPSYDLALMASVCITELGFKMDEEYCRACQNDSTEDFKHRHESVNVYQ